MQDLMTIAVKKKSNLGVIEVMRYRLTLIMMMSSSMDLNPGKTKKMISSSLKIQSYLVYPKIKRSRS